MPDRDYILIERTGETIPLSSLDFATSRSGGPGGQNVNKVETRVEVRLVLDDLQGLSDSTLERLREKLASRIDSSGAIRVVSSSERTQRGNRHAAVERLAQMLNNAMKPEKKRVATRPTRASQQRRLEAKKRLSEKKEGRRGGW